MEILENPIQFENLTLQSIEAAWQIDVEVQFGLNFSDLANWLTISGKTDI